MHRERCWAPAEQSRGRAACGPPARYGRCTRARRLYTCGVVGAHARRRPEGVAGMAKHVRSGLQELLRLLICGTESEQRVLGEMDGKVGVVVRARES